MRAFLIAVAAFAIASCATTTDPDGGAAVRSITMEDEPCFGFCPVYEITLTPDDGYVLDAMRHTATEGRSTGMLETGGFEAAVAALEAADFRSMPSDLTFNNREACSGPQVTDMPYTRFTVEYADGTQTVHHYHGCTYPAASQLREQLREIIGYETLIRPRR